MNLKLQVGEQSLPCREVTVGEQTFTVPRGIARNARNRAWQLKIKRGGVLKASGNFTDDNYRGTAEALDAAIKQMADELKEDGQPFTQSLKISQRMSLTWTTVGVNVLGASAAVYDPVAKKGSVIYLISQRKAVSGHTAGLKSKLVKAFLKEFSQDNEEVSLADMIRLNKQADQFLASPEWAEFMELGVKIAEDAREKQAG